MNVLDFVPGVSFYRFADRAHDTDVPFEIRCYDAVRYGAISGGQFIVATELGFHSMAMIRAAQATVAVAQAAPVLVPAATAAIGASVLYDRKVSETIRKEHYGTPYYGPFAGAFGTVV